MDSKQTPALEELHQLEEPLAVDTTKQTLALEESHQVEPLAEKPKNGYRVGSVSRASCTANEVLPLLQSLLVQNDIQRVCHVWPIYIQILFFIESTLLASERFTLFLFIFFAGESH